MDKPVQNQKCVIVGYLK